MDEKLSTNTDLFRSLFQGREDLFAIRWEKSGKSGYMPAYQFDPYHYRMYKMNGGAFANYPHKTYLPLTEYSEESGSSPLLVVIELYVFWIIRIGNCLTVIIKVLKKWIFWLNV